LKRLMAAWSARLGALAGGSVLPLSPALLSGLWLLKARYLTADQHSPLLAMWCLGPAACLKATLWKLDLHARLRPVVRAVEPWSPADVRGRWHSRPSDVIVAAPPKSGTTWLLQMAHQLRVGGVWGGAASFEDQSDVVRWLEGQAASLLPDHDVNGEQVAEPRLYKSHMGYRSCPGGVRRIYCFRDLADALVSAWHFEGSMLGSGVPLEAYAPLQVVPGGVDRSLHNLCDWWEHRHDEGVLLFFFDELRECHFESVLRVQRFLGVGGGEALARRVVEQSTHEFMTRPENHSKFDDHKIMKEMDRIRGYERHVPLTGKVRRDGGRSGTGREKLPAAVVRWIEWRWQCIVRARLGFESLEEMRAAWASERGEAE